MFSFLTGQKVDDGFRKLIDTRFNYLRNTNHIFFVKNIIFIFFIFIYVIFLLQWQNVTFYILLAAKKF